MATTGTNAQQLVTRLTALQTRIERAREERSELQGELRTLKSQLKQGYGVDSLEAADTLLVELNERITTLEKTLTTRLEEAEAALAEAP